MELLLPDKAIYALENYVILPHKNLNPTLGVIIKKSDKDNPDYVYLRSIEKKAEEYNVFVAVCEADCYVEAADAIQRFKKIMSISGIIVLSSFGEEIDQALYDMIPGRLDLDCTAANTFGRLITFDSPIGFRLGPCAPVAVMKLFEYDNINLEGKKVAIINRSLRVGRPLAEMLTQHNATVTVLHSKSRDYDLNDYDIIVSATGIPHFLSRDQFDDKYRILVDVGISVDENGKVCGDFDWASFADADGMITPAPGCVGKLATTVLFAKLYNNAIEASKQHYDF